MQMNTITTRLTRLAIAFVGIGMLAACGTTKRIAQDGAVVREQTSPVNRGTRQAPLAVDDDTIGSPTQADSRAAFIRTAPVARRASHAWIGARMTAVQSDEVLPPVFTDSVKINFNDRATNGRVSIAVIAERLSRMTNVPVRVKQDVYGQPGAFGGQPTTTTVGGVSLPVGAPVAGAMVPPKGQPSPLPPGTTLPPASASVGGGTAAVTAALPLPSGATLDVAPQAPTYRELVTDVNATEMRWEGSLSSFLDHVTGRLNLSWAYRDGVVVIERYISESFELAAFVGTQDYKMSLSGTNGGQSSNSAGGSSGQTGSTTASLDVNESGKIAALESLRKAIERMVSDTGGSVVLSEGSGRFTVTATKDVMGRVREVLKHEEAAMMRQAHIQIDVYSVTKEDTDERGVDWNIVYQNLSRTWGAVISSPASLSGALGGNVGYSILQPSEADAPYRGTQARFGNSSAMLTLLSQISDTAQYRPVSMIALNRQWARKTNLKTDGYLSETTPGTASSLGTGGGTVGLKTSSIVTGDKFLVQPAILDNGAILLKFGVSLTELLSLFDVSAGSGATFQRVQTPVTSGTDDQTTVRLMPGQAMVVTGLSRRVAAGDTRTLTDSLPIGAGGSRKLGYKREDFMIVVRAVQL
jgi:type IVB pilus formation R64 PilN family outer membrane protein